jgi:hypothetical protein
VNGPKWGLLNIGDGQGLSAAGSPLKTEAGHCG